MARLILLRKRAGHQWQAISGGVQPFLKFTANCIGIDATVGAVQNSAALAAVIHRGSNQCNRLVFGHGVPAIGCMVDVQPGFGRGNRDSL